MGYRKENKFAFDESRKENFIGRLKLLIGERSVRAAAREWGLSFSTLNNYVTRGTEPSFIAMQAIAYAEKISLDWLAFGRGDSKLDHPDSDAIDHKAEDEPEGRIEQATSPSEGKDILRTAWISAFEFMNKTEAEALLKVIISGGARGLIKLAEHDASLEETFMLLPTELKERAINLIEAHEEAKKGASEGSEVSNTASPASDQKQAS